jgi:hypothetical protein
MRAHLSIATAFMLSTMTVAGADQPSIPAARRPTLMCIYHFIKVQPNVLSVGIYAVDGFRSAVQYTFHTPDNNLVNSNFMLLGNGSTSRGYLYTITSEGNNSQKIADEEMGFLDPISEKLESTCHLFGVFDNTMPGPPDAKLWRPIDLRTWATTSQ